MAVEAARHALAHAEIEAADGIGALYVGAAPGRRGPHIVAPALADVLGVSARCHCADVQADSRSGVEVFFAVCNIVKPSAVNLGLMVVADAPDRRHTGPEGRLCGAAAFVITRAEDRMIARVNDQEYLRDASAAPDATHTLGASQEEASARVDARLDAMLRLGRDIMTRRRFSPADFAHAAFTPVDVEPLLEAGPTLGFGGTQLAARFLDPLMEPSNPAFPLVSLAALLDVAKPAGRLLICASDARSGADALVITTTEQITAAQARAVTIRPRIESLRAAMASKRAALTGDRSGRSDQAAQSARTS